jgi:hypothetical protein
MTLPRPLLLALLGLALVGAALFATRGMRSAGGGDETAAPTTSAPKPAPSPSRERTGAGRAGAGSATTPRGARAEAAAVRKLPRPLQRALDKRRLIVLMFAQRGAADDRRVRVAVDALRRIGPFVYVDDVENVERYASIAAPAGVGRAPATLVVTPDRRSRLVEGYIDPKALRQVVVDAVR